MSKKSKKSKKKVPKTKAVALKAASDNVAEGRKRIARLAKNVAKARAVAPQVPVNEAYPRGDNHLRGPGMENARKVYQGILKVLHRGDDLIALAASIESLSQDEAISVALAMDEEGDADLDYDHRGHGIKGSLIATLAASLKRQRDADLIWERFEDQQKEKDAKKQEEVLTAMKSLEEMVADLGSDKAWDFITKLMDKYEDREWMYNLIDTVHPHRASQPT